MWCVSDRAECASPCLSVSVFLPLQPVCLGEATGWPGCGGGEGGGVSAATWCHPGSHRRHTTTVVPDTTCASLTTTSTFTFCLSLNACVCAGE
ncbi:hypothetical protein Pcinc_036771 [Petrolisthes cinctipes]|uniref:Secreted protein n=1 Tax=Petrolisthes cinctipes TaxID=88211 RepID=A0AAE1ELN4_PETCI|nr:hypothetical protein Pcinc_036771 [Petrolisthes cinctipes]